MSKYCYPADADAPRARPRQPVAAQLQLPKNGSLYTAGSSFKGVFVLRRGSSKTVSTGDSGNTQIVRIDLGGDVLGLDGFATGCHTTSVVALESSTFCFVPSDKLMQIVKRRPALQEKLLRAMAQTLVHLQRAAYALAGANAEQRIADFLVTTSERLAERGYSASYLPLNLTRHDVGSLLGLRLETVSRCLSSLEERQFIQVCGRHVELLDPVALRNLAVRVV
jgi:CRP/FNR family transcriptional regulator